MSKLTEKYVQDVSINFLHDYYKSKYGLERIYAKKEVKTTYKKINGRADGLITFKLQDGNIYTVSLEAKSHKTFNSLRTINENKIFFGIGFLFLIVSFIVIHFLCGNYGFIGKWIIPSILSFAFTFGLLLFFQYHAWFEKHGIIEQVRRYPANEKWIAISKDAFKFYNSLDDNELLFRAKKYNIGVLVVSSGKKVQVVLEAKEEKTKKHINYLNYYVTCNKIEKSLNIALKELC